jgi:hydrogenase maturation protease
VVIGVGNEWRSDDAAGLVVARRLRDSQLDPLRVVEHRGEPVDLIEQWSGAEPAIVVDAVQSGAEPGTIHALDASSTRMPLELFKGSTHALGLAEAVELARALDRLPPSLLFYGIEGKSFSAGEGLTIEVERAVGSLVRRLRDHYGDEARGNPDAGGAP